MAPTLLVRAGSSPTTLHPLPINTPTPTPLTPTTTTTVFIRDFSGTPASPPTHPLLTSSPDLFTLHFTLTLDADTPGSTLFLSNTFAPTITSSLPYFFPAAWRALRIFDPGLKGDLYADEPYISSPVLSSMSRIRITDASTPAPELPVVEDMRMAGVELGAAERRRFFLREERREAFVFKSGWRVELAFGNELIDFSGMAVVVPGLGWRVGVFRFWDGENGVRFVVGGEGGRKDVRVVLEFNVQVEGEEKGGVAEKAREEERVEEEEKLREGLGVEDEEKLDRLEKEKQVEAGDVPGVEDGKK